MPNPILSSHKKIGLSNADLILLVAMCSWAMLFGTFILSFVLAKIKSPLWPPPYINEFPLLLPGFSTLTLGLSSYFIVRAEKEFSANRAEFNFYWLMGIFAGLLFGILQTVALSRWMNFDVRGHVYSSSVAFLILFHGIHFLGGWSGLILKYFSPKSAQSLRLWAWFWHFLGVVWLAIFMALAL